MNAPRKIANRSATPVRSPTLPESPAVNSRSPSASLLDGREVGALLTAVSLILFVGMLALVAILAGGGI